MTLAEIAETEEAAKVPVTEETLPAEASALPASNGEPQKLVAPVVTCKGCGQRMTRETMVVKRTEWHHHPNCAPVIVSP